MQGIMHSVHWHIALMVVVGVLSGDIVAAQTPGSPDPPDPNVANANEQVATPTPAEKSDQVGEDPDRLGTVDRMKAFVKKHHLLDRFADDGFYPKVGGLHTGSGFSLGVGFRNHFLDQHAVFRASAVVSMKGYRLIEAEQQFEGLGRFGAFTGVTLTAEHFPQEDFYGIGPRSAQRDRTNYRLDTNFISGTAGVRPIKWLRTGGTLGYMSSEVGPGTDNRYPTIAALFNDGQTPGLIEQPNYLTGSVFAILDTRDVAGLPHRGSYARVEHRLNRDGEFRRYSFDRTDLEVAHFVPRGKTQVLAFHGHLAISDAKPGNVVPFYLWPTVGGSQSLRSLDEFRLRDRNALYMNLEYRWQVRPFLDVVPFVDAGKVSREIGLAHLQSAIGFGLRFRTDEHVVFRVDVAHGGGETEYFFKFGPSF